MAQATTRCKGFIHPSICPLKTCIARGNCCYGNRRTICPFSRRGHFYRATIFYGNRRAMAAFIAPCVGFPFTSKGGQRRRRVCETRKKTINRRRRAKCVSSDGHISRGLFDASSASASFNRCALARSSAVPQNQKA